MAKPQNNGAVGTSAVASASSITLSDLQQDIDLWYRVKVLLYDLSKIGRDPTSEKRLSSTTSEICISEPYFTSAEAARIQGAIIEGPIPVAAGTESEGDNDIETIKPTTKLNSTIQHAIQHNLTNFFEKRRASGDARPCGPHDMAPVYGIVFGVQKVALEDEKFLSRIRRSGVGDLQGPNSKEGKTTKPQENPEGKTDMIVLTEVISRGSKTSQRTLAVPNSQGLQFLVRGPQSPKSICGLY